jgi:dipeptidyl-peptidase-4
VLDLRGDDRELLRADEADVTWGLAEFVAAEEMDRARGFWWAPGGSGLLVARVDESPVGTWWIADPAHPSRPPRAHRYPAAGTDDADVTLWYAGLDGGRTEVAWDRAAFPYLVHVSWTDAGPPLLLVEARDHHRSQVLRADPARGAVAVEREDRDDAWLERAPGVPAWLEGGRLVWAAPDPTCDTYRLVVGGEAVSPPGLQVRAVLDVGEEVVFSGSSQPHTVEVWRWSPSDGLSRLSPDGGVSTVVAGGSTAVVVTRDMTHPRARVTVNGDAEIPNLAATPAVLPAVRWVDANGLAVGVLLPSGAETGKRFPVVMAPYGGPGFQAAMASQHLWWEAQWLADQGFAVVVADGRGTPGRGPAWERRIYRDFASVLDDQVGALEAAVAAVPELDAGRVGIRGWSFGGYLAALAVLRRPDVFHAAVAGAPVTDWSLYDTYYTEKYLGWPVDPAVFARSSLLEDARGLRRPLLIIHGLVDDNVVVAHSLRLSQALLEAGRPHSVLPLSGVTHMTPQEEVAENLLLLQVEFLREHLG